MTTETTIQFFATTSAGPVHRFCASIAEAERLCDEYRGFTTTESVAVTEDGSEVEWLSWSAQDEQDETTEITARIYDTDGTEWQDLPEVREGETLDDYAYRLYQHARREILASASYGDVERLVDVQHEREASVVVYAETADCYVEYCILARQVSYEITAEERRKATAAAYADQDGL